MDPIAWYRKTALGTFMDSTPALIIFILIVMKLTEAAGFNPIHVGVLTTIVLCFGFLTTPYELTLLISAGIGKVPIMGLLKH